MSDLAEMAAKIGLVLTGREVEQFALFEDLLLEWNQRINLTRIVDPVEIRRRHFLDALTCSLVTGDLSNKRVIDIGTGAGFPGLPLKIHFPAMKLTLLESVQKKTHFLAAVVNHLSLEGVTILHDRAENTGREAIHREQYDWAIARSVASMPVLVEYLLPFCCLGGTALAQKGSGFEEEVAAAAFAIKQLGGGPPQIQSVPLPGRDQPHYLISIPKVRPTPEIYPRRPGIPTKRPL